MVGKPTKSPKAPKFLKALFENGEVSDDATPKSVYRSDAEFQKYDLAVFRNHFNKDKAAFGIHLRSVSSSY
jgi:hypothetical protein